MSALYYLKLSRDPVCFRKMDRYPRSLSAPCCINYSFIQPYQPSSGQPSLLSRAVSAAGFIARFKWTGFLVSSFRNPQLARFVVAQSLLSSYMRLESKMALQPSALFQPHQHHYVHAANAVCTFWQKVREPSGSVWSISGRQPDKTLGWHP